MRKWIFSGPFILIYLWFTNALHLPTHTNKLLLYIGQQIFLKTTIKMQVSYRVRPDFNVVTGCSPEIKGSFLLCYLYSFIFSKLYDIQIIQAPYNFFVAL